MVPNPKVRNTDGAIGVLISPLNSNNSINNNNNNNDMGGTNRKNCRAEIHIRILPSGRFASPFEDAYVKFEGDVQEQAGAVLFQQRIVLFVDRCKWLTEHSVSVHSGSHDRMFSVYRDRTGHFIRLLEEESAESGERRCPDAGRASCHRGAKG